MFVFGFLRKSSIEQKEPRDIRRVPTSKVSLSPKTQLWDTYGRATRDTFGFTGTKTLQVREPF